MIMGRVLDKKELLVREGIIFKKKIYFIFYNEKTGEFLKERKNEEENSIIKS